MTYIFFNFIQQLSNNNMNEMQHMPLIVTKFKINTGKFIRSNMSGVPLIIINHGAFQNKVLSILHQKF